MTGQWKISKNGSKRSVVGPDVEEVEVVPVRVAERLAERIQVALDLDGSDSGRHLINNLQARELLGAALAEFRGEGTG